ncbi:sulfur oxidation c-type cytochrome SoxA [Methylovirgula sp. HY1]|uniref:sulfur oxidation c-type cytochrome SoxA n=1 Tax=Methylovirgula sp. HY1 TaxID=2822761 RepID=UPI001C5B6DA6|nr:sulfur oxidation c-type cytochrome SoxA [Methylovirgula sp. HY1]QXX73270.1 SoxAX cytochrome complex subunit A [Methylovirgula sp. HY1]
MKGLIAGVLIVGGLLLQAPARAADTQAADSNLAKYSVGTKHSGYVLASPATRAMEDDEFQNPGMLWVETGKKLWSTADGANGKSCHSCHGDAAKSMKGIATAYPKFNPRLGKVIDMEQRINACRAKAMQAKPYPWESRELLALTAYIKNQSHGMPMNVLVTGAAVPSFEKGKALFMAPHGPKGLSCASCHGTLEASAKLAATQDQGQTNGFPAYRLTWQTLGSAQRQIQDCERHISVAPHPLGSPADIDLEFYLAWRGNGLPVETPAVRK